MEEIKLKGNDKTAKDESTYIVLQIVIEMLARGIEFYTMQGAKQQ